MAESRKRSLIQSRRRREDEGEEEGSLTGELDNISMSEGSAISVVEEDEPEGSEASNDEDRPLPAAHVDNPQLGPAQSQLSSEQPGSISDGAFKTTAATEAMLNGVKISGGEAEGETLNFDEDEPVQESLPARQAKSPPKGPRLETVAQRSRREHLEYIRQRDADPAFVPNRGGFFLHDNRSSNTTVPPAWPAGRGRGRAVRPTLNERTSSSAEASGQQWVHDLHETVNASQRLADQSPVGPMARNDVKAHAQNGAPNRQFSFTTTLGKISVQVLLPGMESRITTAPLVKKQYTLLPQHRPPLRRDKPVRISIPDESPRYIFPSADRSFIFIPRALRPNQQSYVRGRGRGSQQGSRRTSLFGGSIYTPSMAMSRKSSIGPATSVEAVFSASEYASVPGRPGVLMPANAYPIVSMPTGPAFTYRAQQPEPMQQPATIRGPTAGLPMHQPRPQKAVSVAEIEPPVLGSLKAPAQQQEQPFHQQMPEVGGQVATPLAHIPEGAVYAQPFQPHNMAPSPGYFGAPFPSNAMFYPPFQQSMPYGMPMMVAPPAPNFSSIPSYAPMGLPPYAPTTIVQASQQGALAHESNGMVFYYDSSQMSTNGFNGAPNMPTHPQPMNASQFYYPAPTGMYPPTQAG